MKQRIVTSLVLLPPLVAVLALGATWPLAALCLIVLVLCHRELSELLGERGALPVLGVAAFFLGIWLEGWSAGFGEPALQGCLALFTVAGVAGAFLARGWVADQVGGLWIACPLAALCRLHLLGSPGTVWNWGGLIWLAVVPVWAGDIAGMLVGRRFGRHALAPRISPGKTWEGAVGNLLACLAASGFLGWMLGVPWWIWASTGAAIGVFGQIGDLLQSALKRRAAVKDSGHLLPGHGGLFDRIDSLLLGSLASSGILAAWLSQR